MDKLATEAAALKPLAVIVTFGALSVFYFVGLIIYRLYFHPLSHVPGPWYNKVSRLPHVRHIVVGTTVDSVKQLHDKYGDVVQISPNEVSFTSNTAWQDIYGFRTGKHKGHLNMQKDPVWYTRSPTGQSIITADDADHSRFRKVLAHAFSAQALAKQEDILHRYVDLLVNRLKETLSTDERPQDMTEWYNWTTFDVIADLMFGEPFGCLQNRETHKYITLIFLSIRALRMGYIMSYYPWVKWFGNWIVDKKSLAGRKEYYNWVVSRTQTRMDRETQRPDFMTEVLKNNGKKDAELTTTEIYSNFGVLLTAGSETSATLLSGLTYLLGKNPEVHQKLKDEVRGRFKNFGDINCKEVNDLPYLLAVLQEALRYFPPVPTGFERRVGPGGEFVSGCFIPANTAVCVSAYPAGHSERNFKDSSLFVPERWLNDPRYAGDKKDSIQPFSIGPRNCLGKNLAYTEMRLILAKMIWTFDMELDPKSANWFDELKCMVLWNKPGLFVKVTEVARD